MELTRHEMLVIGLLLLAMGAPPNVRFFGGVGLLALWLLTGGAP